MTSQDTLNKYGADLEALMGLRTYPIAIKMLRDEAETPEGAVRPKKDRGEHYALCQVFSLVRRQGITIAMFLEDHWCFEPIIVYGLVDTPQDYLEGFTAGFFIADKDAAPEAVWPGTPGLRPTSVEQLLDSVLERGGSPADKAC